VETLSLKMILVNTLIKSNQTKPQQGLKKPGKDIMIE